MKTYNIGFDKQDGGTVGFIVPALDSDQAERLARAVAVELNIAVRPGSLRQRRDPDGYNEFFDKSYPLAMKLH